MSFNGNGYPETEGFDITNKGSIHTSSGTGNTAQAVSGNNGYVLSENSSQSNGLEWIANPAEIGFDNSVKGDIHTFSTTQAKIGVSGNDGYLLSEDSSEVTGLKWIAAPSGGANTTLSNLTAPTSVNTYLAMNANPLIDIQYLQFSMNTNATLDSSGDADFTINGATFLNRVDTYAGASTDDWTSNTATNFTRIWSTFSCSAQTRVVTVIDNTANIIDGNFTLNHTNDRIHGVWQSGASWAELGRSDNAT
jgi:hypothetical protein